MSKKMTFVQCLWRLARYYIFGKLVTSGVRGDISYISRVIANFGLKFPNFHYHGNKGQSGLNFNDTIKLPDLVNPHFGTRCSIISLI